RCRFPLRTEGAFFNVPVPHCPPGSPQRISAARAETGPPLCPGRLAVSIHDGSRDQDVRTRGNLSARSAPNAGKPPDGYPSPAPATVELRENRVYYERFRKSRENLDFPSAAAFTRRIEED